jgi:hypothetical protein
MSEPRSGAVGLDSDHAIPSPGLVLWEIGRVIAVCLGLAVIANLLLRLCPDRRGYCEFPTGVGDPP